jgi:hypothetical protein
MFIGCSVIMASIGASMAVMTSWLDEPMCRQITVPVSSQAARNGSQWSLCQLGWPSFSGFSEKVTAWQPLPAMRRTSSAISWGSQMGGTARGIMRPGWAPHQSSTCQSL